MRTVTQELRELLPTWGFAVLLPAPAATLWHNGSGRAFAFAYFFVGCAVMAADCFGRVPSAGGSAPGRVWRAKIAALVVATAGASAAFTAFAWAVSGRVDFGVPTLAGLVATPALCCVPYLTLVTGRPFAGVLLGAALLGLVKCAGGLVVWLVYGANAIPDGRTAMSWDQPNLLVGLCLAGALLCSAGAYPLGRRAFVRAGEAQPAGVACNSSRV
jgi:hypothetical protein